MREWEQKARLEALPESPGHRWQVQDQESGSPPIKGGKRRPLSVVVGKDGQNSQPLLGEGKGQPSGGGRGVKE